MLIKVVPEFVTWNAMPEPNDTYDGLYSANWYNDANWSRSTRAELYKDANGNSAQQNTPTVGHPGGYDNNGEGSLAAFTPTLMAGKNLNPGYVPMKFTNVIMPSGNHAPSLINEPKVYIGVTGSVRQGGGFLDTNQTTLLTDCSPNVNKEPSRPTEYIYYDMLVRYGKHEDGGVGCFGHRYLKEDGSWDDHAESPELPDAKVFDVEKYYGNVCRDIYFRPGSEILRQHRLIYEKAWVEMELEPNKWYLLSAPLKDTYAGDMYVPTEMNDVRESAATTVKGQQLTEAFQPIRFDKVTKPADRAAKVTSQPAYSRTQYPIYQRSWGDNNGEVYTKAGDMRANRYTANLGYTSVSGVAAEWGHTFNDVQVPYTALSGFSIRTHRKDQTDNTLIRLPKADTSYDYFDYQDTSSDPAAGAKVKTVSKTNVNRLVTDDHQNDGELTARISDLQHIGDYVLVGNPYLCTIDMEKFFAVNHPARRASVTMTATDGSASSKARVELSGSASDAYVGGEDVMALFDSNLSGVPTIFTMAQDGQALAVDARPTMELVPFGVYCGNSADAVEVTICNREWTMDNGQLYILDAVTGDVTEVQDGGTVTVQPNDYGRYFLTTRSDLTAISEAKAARDGIVVSVRGRDVTVRSDSELKSVRVLTIGGNQVNSVTDAGKDTTVSVAVGGIYIIEVQTANSQKTVKVVVK